MRRKKEIELLRTQLESARKALSAEETKNAYIDASPLPKCKSLACVNCEHIVYFKAYERIFVIGCGKDLKCQDFKLTTTSREPEDRLLLQQALLERSEL